MKQPKTRCKNQDSRARSLLTYRIYPTAHRLIPGSLLEWQLTLQVDAYGMSFPKRGADSDQASPNQQSPETSDGMVASLGWVGPETLQPQYCRGC